MPLALFFTDNWLIVYWRHQANYVCVYEQDLRLCNYVPRRRMEKEAKAKVVVFVWGADLV